MSPHVLTGHRAIPMRVEPAPEAVRDLALLRTHLAMAVPLERTRLAQGTEEQRAAQLASLDTHELHADDVLYAGRYAAEGIGNLVLALALLSFAPGGVTYAGLHWCPDHDACLAAEREAAS